MGLFNSIASVMVSGKSIDKNFEHQVREDGVEYASKKIADILNEKITSHALARQFILEELDAARQGNEAAVQFVIKSGFARSEYLNAMERTIWAGEESELEHIQLFFRAYLMKISDTDLMVSLSLGVVDNIMLQWKMGKYQSSKRVVTLMDMVKKINHTEYGLFADIQNDLGLYAEEAGMDGDPLILMAYGYARRASAAGLYLQGLWGEEEYTYAKTIFLALQQNTGHTVQFQEDAYTQAIELMHSYDKRLDRQTVSILVSLVESGGTDTPKDENFYFDYNAVIEMVI